MDLLCFCFVLCLLCLCARLFICALWSPAGKGLTSWLSFVVSAVSLSLSHWYPGSGVVLDCIDSLSLHPYLLCRNLVVVHISRCSLFRGYFIFIKTGCAGRTLNTPLIHTKTFSNNLLSDNKCRLPEF